MKFFVLFIKKTSFWPSADEKWSRTCYAFQSFMCECYDLCGIIMLWYLPLKKWHNRDLKLLENLIVSTSREKIFLCFKYYEIGMFSLFLKYWQRLSNLYARLSCLQTWHWSYSRLYVLVKTGNQCWCRGLYYKHITIVN